VDRVKPERSLPSALIASFPLVAESHENGIGRYVNPAIKGDGIKGVAIGCQSYLFENLAVLIQKYRAKAKVLQLSVAHDQRIGKPDVTRQIHLPLIFGIAVFDGKVIALPLSGVPELLNGEAIRC